VTGMTALLFAAERSTNPEVVLLLLRSGANPHVVGPGGESALALARRNGSLRGTSAADALARELP